jgi:hypothetical protein
MLEDFTTPTDENGVVGSDEIRLGVRGQNEI